MTFVRGLFSFRFWFGRAFAGVMLACVLGGGALAADGNYVLRDGRKIPLVRSNTELAVIFRSHEEVEDARQRLEAAGHGVVRDIEGARGALVKILQVPTGGSGDVLRGQIQEDPAVEDVQPVYRFGGANSPIVPTGTMVVKLRNDLTGGQRGSLWADFRIVDVEEFEGLHDVYIVKAVEGADEVALAEQLADDGRTLWANPNFRRVVHPRQVAAADEFFPFQWHLKNTGQTGGLEGADIDAPEAWALAGGDGVLFGMFDTSCDVDHEDLRDNYIGKGQDINLFPFEPGYNDPRPKDFFEDHGTAVMGLAVAAGNSVGVRGVAFRGKFTATRAGFFLPTETEIASAYTFAVDEGVDVHINSWGWPFRGPNPPVIEDAIETAFAEGRDLDGEGGDPPLGMVILFATGNADAENVLGLELSTMPQVIGVGASNDRDERVTVSNTGFWGSNFGADLNFLAPGAGTGTVGIVTTDNEDDRVSPGYNVGGNFGSEIDPSGKYTGSFGGTSAACPIAAGVAGLILSVNKNLTATDVRIIMDHSCDQISPDDARYDGVTSKSFKYGYGRINAHSAVRAAEDALTNGGHTWPDLPSDIEIERSTLKWKAGTGTDEFLMVESVIGFDLAPLENACFHNDQAGCNGATLASLPIGATVLFVGCGDEGKDCQRESEQSVDFQRSRVGTKLLAIYGRNASTGRYSFGARVEVQAIRPPAVTITALPLRGRSPLTVRFNGNGLSDAGIDESRIEWDFDYSEEEGFTVDARTALAEHEYVVERGVTQTFRARLRMEDVLGNAGSTEVWIVVIGLPAEDAGAPVPTSTTNVRVLVGVPGTPGSSMSEGPSPFSVELRIEADLPGNVQAVEWDLGDGTQATGLIVPHIYINAGGAARSLVVVAKVTMADSDGKASFTTTINRVITVLPGVGAADPGQPHLFGTEPQGAGGPASPCGALGMVPLLFGTASLMWMRRRRF